MCGFEMNPRQKSQVNAAVSQIRVYWRVPSLITEVLVFLERGGNVIPLCNKQTNKIVHISKIYNVKQKDL